MKLKTPNKRPKTLRDALDIIESLLDGRPFSAELWDVLVGLRGPDSRNVAIKNATTAVIRQAAFPNKPTALLSVYRKDSQSQAKVRTQLFVDRKDTAHFREHVLDAFNALGLGLFNRNRL